MDGSQYYPKTSAAADYAKISAYVAENGDEFVTGSFDDDAGSASWSYDNVAYSLTSGTITPTVEEL